MRKTIASARKKPRQHLRLNTKARQECKRYYLHHLRDDQVVKLKRVTDADLQMHPRATDAPKQSPMFVGSTYGNSITCYLSKFWARDNFDRRPYTGFFKLLMNLEEGSSIDVPIGNCNEVPPDWSVPVNSPKIRFQQGSDATCSFLGLGSALSALGDDETAEQIVKSATASLKEGSAVVQFVVELLKNKSNGWTDMRRVSDKKSLMVADATSVTLCVLRNNHSVTLWNGWIFDSNVSHALPLSDAKWFSWCCGAAPGHNVNVTEGVVVAYQFAITRNVRRSIKKQKTRAQNRASVGSL